MPEEIQEIQEILLPGEKLSEEKKNNLDLISRVGSELYQKNKDFIKEKIKDNWFVLIEPISGTLMAYSDQLKLYEYASKKFPDKVFFSLGLLKDNFL